MSDGGWWVGVADDDGTLRLGTDVEDAFEKRDGVLVSTEDVAFGPLDEKLTPGEVRVRTPAGNRYAAGLDRVAVAEGERLVFPAGDIVVDTAEPSGGDDKSPAEEALEILRRAERDWDGINNEERRGAVHEARTLVEEAVGDG